jgi:hypothetical protein
MEGTQTILEPPEQTASSSRATEKKSQVFSFGAFTRCGVHPHGKRLMPAG